MRFRILGHACLNVAASKTSLLCDPWLVGSAYWRSWWNYPPVPDGLVERLKPDFIYITHMHWDHFHGPTLRRLGLDRHILVPKTPDRRIYNDLKAMGFSRITELAHAKPFRIDDNFQITSYQFGYFPDSVLMIEVDGKTIMNANDCKIMGPPLQQILRNHPKIDFLLRSHSSANARLCFEIMDRGGGHLDDQKKYSAEFAEFAQAVRATYAIPFASNNCYLHPETEKFNKYLNLGINVKRHFEEHRITEPECVVCAPGDGWDDELGFILGDTDWYTDLGGHLERYKQAKATTLEKTARREAKAVLRESSVGRYAEELFSGTPFVIRRLFRGKPITLVAHNDAGDSAYELDLYRRRWRKLDSWNDQDNPIQIHAQARVFLMCINQVNWNSLGISKRVRFRVKDADKKVILYFMELNDLFDCEVLPLSKSLNGRFILVWLKRWREATLYMHIMADLIRGRGFVYRNYLPAFKGPDELRT
ncbi:MBL fold metallo-hydrolase [Siccirubricoccus sp. G192]|uniref:MBL fold metallo-hydrolase n=1 Tax=Siccirubricoccus sp. G192 TaxID=2849651 RepID=UPI001C2BE7E4|nr:MBL fold metallo-hydrolase [Siccirubricoccus sp. G192]MBV1797530.1 MBL fold metallo-hydrolase [Siccirubricoccus sp. G192]